MTTVTENALSKTVGTGYGENERILDVCKNTASQSNTTATNLNTNRNDVTTWSYNTGAQSNTRTKYTNVYSKSVYNLCRVHNDVSVELNF